MNPEELVREGLDSGARGYVLKSDIRKLSSPPSMGSDSTASFFTSQNSFVVATIATPVETFARGNRNYAGDELGRTIPMIVT